MPDDSSQQEILMNVMQEMHLLMMYAPETYQAIHNCPVMIRKSFQGPSLPELNGALVELLMARQLKNRDDLENEGEKGEPSSS